MTKDQGFTEVWCVVVKASTASCSHTLSCWLSTSFMATGFSHAIQSRAILFNSSVLLIKPFFTAGVVWIPLAPC